MQSSHDKGRAVLLLRVDFDGAAKCLDQTDANFISISNVMLPTDIEFRFDKELPPPVMYWVLKLLSGCVVAQD